jgi:hypothetical protein
MGGRLALACAALVALLAGAAPASAWEAFEGPIHEHTAYSDGEPRTRPADAFAAVRERGSDFMALTEHSDTLLLPIVTNLDCLDPAVLPACVIADQVNRVDSLRKWDAMAEQTDAATDDAFAGIRGFEWTNDRHGHISVLFSHNNTNAKIDLGYLTMDAFWSWLARPATEGGGSDGLAIFNHPGQREISDLVPGGFLDFLPDIPLPGSRWDDLRYVPAVDHQVVGIELFNGNGDYGDPDGTHPAGSYGLALDRGWHVGAIGAEDTHDRSWGVPRKPKTVILAGELTRSSLREALEARRFYAIRRAGVRLGFTANGQPMGSRLAKPETGEAIAFAASTNVPGATIELVASGGEVVASGTETLEVSHPYDGERWFFVRVRDAEGASVAYSSPVWLE